MMVDMVPMISASWANKLLMSEENRAVNALMVKTTIKLLIDLLVSAQMLTTNATSTISRTRLARVSWCQKEMSFIKPDIYLRKKKTVRARDSIILVKATEKSQ